MEEVYDVRAKWYELGVHLRMKTSDLDAIKTEYQNNPHRCLLEMLSLWLKRKDPSPPTLQNVVVALSSRAINRKDIAQKIQESFCNQSITDRMAETSNEHDGSKYYSVKIEMELLESEFVQLKDKVCESVIAQPVEIFKYRITSLKVGEVEHHMDYLKEIIQNKCTVIDILVELNCYLNFLNYGLLQHILDKFENKELQVKMDGYKMKINNFFKCTHICDFMECWQKHECQPSVEHLQKFIEVKTHKNWETCTLQDLDNLKGKLATKLFLPNFSLTLEKARKGCLAVTFSIPVTLVDYLQIIIRKTEFMDMDIETITVDGVVVYDAPLLQYTSLLKRLYTSRSPLQPLPDSKPKPLLPFRLARIEKQSLSPSDMDRFTKESLRGDMDDVVYKKTAMELSKLGVMGDGSRPQVVLIEGAPGVGKTTFAWHQCRQWAEGSLLQAYSIVLLLPLRDNNIRQISSLSDLFRHSQRQVREEVSRRVAESGGAGCLIWLEAWDELPEHLRSDSLFTQLIQGTQLPSATIFITTRPWATGGLLATVGDRLSQDTELLALAKEEVENEIRGMTNFDSGFDFQQFIESNPMIRAAMYTPVSAAIVEQVFKSAPPNPPTTVTGLYSAYVLMRLEQHLSEHPDYSGSNIQVRTLADLPERVLGDLQRLCSLAYEGVSQQMIVFSSLPEGVSTLGLLETVPQVYDEGEDRVSYNFLHYTVQEYLAALHLSHLQPQQLMTIVDTKYLRLVIKYGRSYYEATQYKTTFQFLAGITMLEPFPVDFLSDLLKKEAATVYRWLYESQNQPLLTSVLGSGGRGLRLSYSATPTDYFAAGYCLAHSNCRWNINLTSTDDVSMEFLSKGCNHQLSETGISSQLVTALFIGFVRGFITAEGVGHFLTIPNSLLQHLNLSCNKLDRRGCELLAEGVQRMPCLEELDLSSNSGIGCGGAVQLVSSLQYCSKLRELDMDKTGISDPDFQCLATYVSSTTSLEVLDIGGNDISVESIDSLCKALSANSSMRRLNMSHCHLTTSHCVCLGQLLRHPIHCQIERLNIINCSLTSDGVEEVVSGLSDNTTLRELDLSCNQIGSEGAVAVATMLKTNSSLERLNLRLCDIGSRGGVELGAALERNKTLRHLDLSLNALGDDGVKGLCVGLENNSSLERLRLCGDESLGEEGALLLYQQTSEKQGMLSPRRLRISYDEFTSVEVWNT